MSLRALLIALALAPTLALAGPRNQSGDGGTKGEEKEEECRSYPSAPLPDPLR